MKKSIFFATLLAVVSFPVISENDPQSAQAFIAEKVALMSPVQLAYNRTHAAREPGRRRNISQDAIANYHLAINEGRKLGNADHVTKYHVDKESGGNRFARNPRSTATGVAQVVYRTHIAITGEHMSKEQHFQKATDPLRAARIMAAHIKACQEMRPDWSPQQLHRSGYMAGLRNCGSSLDRARVHYARLAGDATFTIGDLVASYRIGENSGG